MITLQEEEGRGSVTRVALPSGHVALIDTGDLELISTYRWFIRRSRGGLYVRGYPLGGPNVPDVHLHRLILGAPDGAEVDHINRDGLDNRRANLRLVTRAQNVRNMGGQRRSRSGYKGVAWDARTSKWRAKIEIDGHAIHLGRFADAWDAAQAYNAAARAAWGEFAFQNTRQVSR